jgi:hypothetical protein
MFGIGDRLKRALFHTLEQKLRVALAVMIFAVVVFAPALGIFAIAPGLMAIGVTDTVLASLLGVALAEALTIAALALLVQYGK